MTSKNASAAAAAATPETAQTTQARAVKEVPVAVGVKSAAAPRKPAAVRTAQKSAATAAKPAAAAKKPTAASKPNAASKKTAATKKPAAAASQPASTSKKPAEEEILAKGKPNTDTTARKPVVPQTASPASKAVAPQPSSTAEKPVAPQTASPAEKAVEAQATPPAEKAVAPQTVPPANKGDTPQSALPTEKPAAAQAMPPAGKPVAPQPATPAETAAARQSAPPAAEPSGTPDFDALTARLMNLQQQVRAAKIPVVLVLEGWDAAGKGTVLGRLLQGLDPRGYKVHVIGSPSREQKRYPLLKRYWEAMPAQGNLSIFLNSWYRTISDACLEENIGKKELERRYADIRQMESQLVCDGALVLKCFLHITRKEQKKRLKALEAKRSTRWRVTKDDWAQNEQYDRLMKLYDAMMQRTHREGALWHVLQSEDAKTCAAQMFELLIKAFERALEQRAQGDRPWDTVALPYVDSLPTAPIGPLSGYNAGLRLDGDYKRQLDEKQKRLRKLQNELYLRKIPMVLAFEGWDAAGKGGAIKRLAAALDPRGYEVFPISAPTAEEKSHHHLWRFWRDVPKTGHIAIFDRTWYGRLMVERIEGFCTETQWKRAYEELNQFEQALLNDGCIVRKFWLQISSEEQLARFRERQGNPLKQWKITDEDWRNRDKWPQYEQAVNEMLLKTNTAQAPWTVVEANDKHFARCKVLDVVIAAMEERLAQEDK